MGVRGIVPSHVRAGEPVPLWHIGIAQTSSPAAHTQLAHPPRTSHSPFIRFSPPLISDHRSLFKCLVFLAHPYLSPRLSLAFVRLSLKPFTLLTRLSATACTPLFRVSFYSPPRFAHATHSARTGHSSLAFGACLVHLSLTSSLTSHFSHLIRISLTSHSPPTHASSTSHVCLTHLSLTPHSPLAHLPVASKSSLTEPSLTSPSHLACRTTLAHSRLTQKAPISYLPLASRAIL